MQDTNNTTGNENNSAQNSGNSANKNTDKKITDLAHEEAEKDIDNDNDLKGHGPEDDLDEGEFARLRKDIPDA